MKLTKFQENRIKSQINASNLKKAIDFIENNYSQEDILNIVEEDAKTIIENLTIHFEDESDFFEQGLIEYFGF